MLGGGGVDTFNVTGSTIGATIDGGTGASKLVVSGGGTVTMGSSITSIAGVTLSSQAGQPDYVFTANAIQKLKITGSAGNDTIVVGDASQSVVLTGAVERVKATAAQAGALVTGGTGQNTLEITTGGTATLNANTTNVTVVLDQASTLTLSKKSGISAFGSTGADTIKAAATGQTIDGGLGNDQLYGFSGFGTTFSGASAELNGDTIRTFGGNDAIDLTDLAFNSGSTSLGYAPGTGKGALSLSDGTHNVALTMIGNFSQNRFSIASDGHSGTLVTYT